jgi:nucleoside-diphosphate-sugar epimerase
VHGDGTSLWTLTHHVDFAHAFVGLLGHTRAIGEAYTITSDDVLTWNQIYTLLGTAAGAEPRLVHVTSAEIAAADPRWGESLLGDKSHSMLFDNTKIKTLVPGYVATIPFEQGAREMVAWHDEDPARQVLDDRVTATIERLLSRRRSGDQAGDVRGPGE